MMSLTIAPTLVLLAANAGAAGKDAGQEGRRHVEKAAGFSLVPPEGWKVQELPGLKYKLLVGPIMNQFAANINITDEAAAISLDDYVKTSAALLQKVLKKYRPIGQAEFKTTDGLRGVKLENENEEGGKRLRQNIYFFENDGRNFVVTFTRLAEQDEQLDRAADSSLKTFRFEKK